MSTTTLAKRRLSARTVNRHCPKCFKVRLHVRHIRNGMEFLKCQGCGHEQVYNLPRCTDD